LAALLTWGLPTTAVVHGQTQDAVLLLPEESGQITVAGCLQRGGEGADKYVLANPVRRESFGNVPDDTCTATVDVRALELEHARRHGIDDSMLGRWIEVSGRLERETSSDPDNLRELYVETFRIAGPVAQEWRRDASLLPPEEDGVLTVAGCLQRGGRNGDKYVLASPMRGPIPNVPEDRCDAAIDDRAVELEHEGAQGINESMLGRWVEANGRLERETSSDPESLRELHVRSFRVLPVVPPQRAAAAPAPLPQPQRAEPPIRAPETPVATTGPLPTTLPKTASPLPAIGLLGLLSLAGAGGVRLCRSRRRG
jgi:hypothetical protein